MHERHVESGRTADGTPVERFSGRVPILRGGHPVEEVDVDLFLTWSDDEADEILVTGRLLEPLFSGEDLEGPLSFEFAGRTFDFALVQKDTNELRGRSAPLAARSSTARRRRRP
ncbi:MAG: hypothetical protein U0Q12_13690 [Vicinamibacterales bacterium]